MMKILEIFLKNVMAKENLVKYTHEYTSTHIHLTSGQFYPNFHIKPLPKYINLILKSGYHKHAFITHLYL